jgi:hypothetical protein
MSLQHLPTELLEHILASLAPLSIINLAQTCKALPTIVLPYAYHSMNLSWLLAEKEAPRLQSLLHTLVETPEYAK